MVDTVPTLGGVSAKPLLGCDRQCHCRRDLLTALKALVGESKSFFQLTEQKNNYMLFVSFTVHVIFIDQFVDSRE